jgi:uncharacterized protein (TIGR03663 family)
VKQSSQAPTRAPAAPAAARAKRALALLSVGAFLLALGVAAFLRLDALGNKPLHHDEGVNGWFLTRLYDGLREPGWQVRYTYDPVNYHGPFLYFAGLLPLFLLGPTKVALRLLPALAGIGCVALLWPLRRWLGGLGLATAAFLLALSPPLVFFSRTAIHESYFVFSSLALFVCLLRASAGRGGRREPGGPDLPCGWIFSAFLALALLVTNKETWVLTLAAFACAAAVAARDRLRALWPANERERRCYDLAVLAAVVLTLLLYTSFLHHPRGAIDMFATFRSWWEHGKAAGGHEKPFGYWGELLWRYDLPLLVLALLGAVAALVRRDRFARFVTAWAGSLWLIYSLIPYKTPWLVVNFTVPMALLGGVAAREAVRRLAPAPGWPRVAALVAVPLFLAACPVPAGGTLSAGGGPRIVPWARLTWDASFVHYDDERHPIVYVQTVRDFERLAARLDALFARRGDSMTVLVTAADYFPLPFYVARHARSVSYSPRGLPAGLTPDVVVASAHDETLRGRLAGYREEDFTLRPGVDLALYVEPSL